MRDRDSRAEEKDLEIIIPENILDSKRILGFRRKNVIEGIILAAIFAIIILQIPFVTRIKVIFIIILCSSVLGLSCVGIKDKSVSEIFIDIKYNLSLPKQWHLRSIKDAKKRKKFKVSEESSYSNLSFAEKIYYTAKQKYKEFQSKRES